MATTARGHLHLKVRAADAELLRARGLAHAAVGEGLRPADDRDPPGGAHRLRAAVGRATTRLGEPRPVDTGVAPLIGRLTEVADEQRLDRIRRAEAARKKEGEGR